MTSLLLLALLAADVPPLAEPERAIVRTAAGEWRIERDIAAEPADEARLIHLAFAQEEEASGEEEDEASADLRDAFEEAVDMARHPD
jgi:hypothetical protein